MKKLFIFVFIITAFLLFSSQSRNDQQQMPQAPFSRGVGFSFWFEYVKNVHEINANRYTEQDFIDAKRLGFDVIRLYIDFPLFSSGAPNYIIDPHLFRLLDTAVDLAEKHQLYIILNNHKGNMPAVDRSIRNLLLPIWRQVAEHYKNRSEYVIYEIMNEPNGISNSDWGRIQGEVIQAIRRIDPDRWIVVGGTEFNQIHTMVTLPRYNDNKLLYTFHFYAPHIFTHQGATWTHPPLDSLAGAMIPFPYDRNRMPTMPNELRRTYIEDAFRNYPREATAEALARQIDQAANFARQRNVPVFCGEFGAPWRHTIPQDRIIYYQSLREAFEARNIPWIMHNYFECYGLFNPQIDGLFTTNYWGDINTDLNVNLVRALGLTPVPQQRREPMRSGFSIYDDNLGRGVMLNHSPPLGTLNWYYTPAADGRYAIHLGNMSQWEGIFLQLPVMDLTFLAQNGFVLEFKARREKAFPFDIAFETFQDNINWVISHRIDQRQLPADGRWHTIRIPLSDMRIWGGNNSAWQWVEAPRGGRPVSWTNINMFRILFAHEDGGVHDLYLDSIRVTR
jgi:endoglucanase